MRAPTGFGPRRGKRAFGIYAKFAPDKRCNEVRNRQDYQIGNGPLAEPLLILECGDVSPLLKARTCPRTPKTGIVSSLS